MHHIKSWVPKNWCFWTVLEKTLESPLDCKEIKSVNPKGNQSWIFIGRTDVEAEIPVLWTADGKSQLIRKDSDGKSQLIRKDCCWKILKARGEGDDRGQDGWMASPTLWTWTGASSGRWRTGKLGVLQSLGSQSDRFEQLNSNNNNNKKKTTANSL